MTPWNRRKQEAEVRAMGWKFDEVTWANRKHIFLYKETDKEVGDGRFVDIWPDGTATAGHYEGGLPSFADGLFHAERSKKFIDQVEAFKKIAENLGSEFLLDLMVG